MIHTIGRIMDDLRDMQVQPQNPSRAELLNRLGIKSQVFVAAPAPQPVAPPSDSAPQAKAPERTRVPLDKEFGSVSDPVWKQMTEVAKDLGIPREDFRFDAKSIPGLTNRYPDSPWTFNFWHRSKDGDSWELVTSAICRGGSLRNVDRVESRIKSYLRERQAPAPIPTVPVAQPQPTPPAATPQPATPAPVPAPAASVPASAPDLLPQPRGYDRLFSKAPGEDALEFGKSYYNPDFAAYRVPGEQLDQFKTEHGVPLFTMGVDTQNKQMIIYNPKTGEAQKFPIGGGSEGRIKLREHIKNLVTQACADQRIPLVSPTFIEKMQNQASDILDQRYWPQGEPSRYLDSRSTNRSPHGSNDHGFFMWWNRRPNVGRGGDAAVDINGKAGDVVFAPADGTVLRLNPRHYRTKRENVEMRLANGDTLLMAHIIFDQDIKAGVTVSQGQRMGVLYPLTKSAPHPHLEMKDEAGKPFTAGSGDPLRDRYAHRFIRFFDSAPGLNVPSVYTLIPEETKLYLGSGRDSQTWSQRSLFPLLQNVPYFGRYFEDTRLQSREQ